MAGSESPRSISYILFRIFQLMLAIANAGLSGFFLFPYIADSGDYGLCYYFLWDTQELFNPDDNSLEPSTTIYNPITSVSVETVLSLLFAASVISIFTALSSLVTNCLPHKHLIGAHYFFTPWDFFMVILWIVAVALCGKWMSDCHFFSSNIYYSFWGLDLFKTIFALGVVLIFVFLTTAILGIFLIIRSHNHRHSSTRSAAPGALPPQPVFQIDPQQLLTSPPVYYEPPKQWPPQHHEVAEGGVYVQPSSPQSGVTTIPTHQNFAPQQQSPYAPPRSPVAPEACQPPPPPQNQ